MPKNIPFRRYTPDAAVMKKCGQQSHTDLSAIRPFVRTRTQKVRSIGAGNGIGMPSADSDFVKLRIRPKHKRVMDWQRLVVYDTEMALLQIGEYAFGSNPLLCARS